MGSIRYSVCLTGLFFLVPSLAQAAEPTAHDILERYDAIMGPDSFESDMQMVAHRDDGTVRTYEMKFLKGPDDQFRIWFEAPSSVKGQEVLRHGDDMWTYLPNLKRASRIAARDSFQGSDFANADVLRVNYLADYEPTLVPSSRPDTYQLNLKAKNPNTAYDAIRLWVRKKDSQPVHAEYFATSGALLRSADFQHLTQFSKGYVRPALVIMRNEQVKSRFTEMLARRMNVHLPVAQERFTLADLGR